MRENPNLINPKGMRAFLTDEYAGGHYNWCRTSRQRSSVADRRLLVEYVAALETCANGRL